MSGDERTERHFHGYPPGTVTLGKPEERADGVTLWPFMVGGSGSDLWGTRPPRMDGPPIGVVFTPPDDGCAVPAVVEGTQ